MKKIEIRALLIIILMVFLTSCEKDKEEVISNYLVFPVGRSFLINSTVEIKVGNEEYNSDFIFDSSGGYWLLIPKSSIVKDEIVTIRFTRRKDDSTFFHEITGGKAQWINPSYYIDSDHSVIRSKAEELTEGVTSNFEKARQIQSYLLRQIELRIYRDASLDKASKTYELGYGTCMNFSRLFVALCRAVGIPSRTVWGLIDGEIDDGYYDSHHQWAEFMDDSGYWHATDFGYTIYFELDDVRYLDLIYAAEENTIIKNRNEYQIMLNNLFFFNDYPTAYEAHLGFEQISDNKPDSMIIQYSYTY
jgi:hypothetical protein